MSPTTPAAQEVRAHNHYFKPVQGLTHVDVYRILELFEVTCPVAQHVVKKALAAGRRGAKSPERDMQDIVDSAQRWLEMRAEDSRRGAKPLAEGYFYPAMAMVDVGPMGLAPSGLSGVVAE